MTIIAIDGPAGSGKSTVAKTIAERLQLPYLDTGAMYRIVGLVAIERGIATDDDEQLGKLAADIEFELFDERIEGRLAPRAEVAGKDVTKEIRTPEVSQAASAVAVHPVVREHLVLRQRKWASEHGGAVAEGRDIGSVVFPEADLKVYLTADHAERVKRRQQDDQATGFSGLSSTEVAKELNERDERDSNRAVSPLTVPEGSLVLDTSDFGIEEVVAEVIEELRKRFGQLPKGSRS